MPPAARGEAAVPDSEAELTDEPEPIPLMFNRAPDTEPMLHTDPAMDGAFWADTNTDDEPEDVDDAEEAEEVTDVDDDEPTVEPTREVANRSALLPKVEVFQDGEHAEAVRPAARHSSPASVVAELALATGTDAAPRRRRPAKPALQYSVPTEGILTAYPDGQYWIIDDKTQARRPRSSGRPWRNSTSRPR